MTTKHIIFFCFLTMGIGLTAKAQVSVGVYKSSVFTHLGVGTDPEKKYFGEVRLFAGDWLNNYFGAEVLGQRNFSQTEWYNFSAGLMVGYHEFNEGMVGIPAFFSIKPLQANTNLSLVLEATPFVAYSSVHLRGSIGVRYFLRKE
ncbi:glycyl-tRNA synthetase [Lunatimonas lonarensis]|uniref:Glycyl-tRNA synthetase n=1 Tax=Lunatimonas lonarensis TaxID=1232681 RepID=R7ZVC2_9BACT|nr:hypothetical protein [Lunatimonas lonarensis]EON77959.1 glycyl-tRNA synthetase [Lunatimonas lonarensis]